jgi:uncharacterized SAM-binding protein YcdF (DUF218 family)
MDTFTFLKYLTVLALPPASMAVGLLAGGLLAMVGLRRLALSIGAAAIAETLILSFPPVTDALFESLQATARAEAAAAPACCYAAIVVLGGNIAPERPPYLMEPDLTDAADRTWYAARLYHRGIAPRIIVSGGSLPSQAGQPTSEAEAMRRFLTDLGVPFDAIVSEGDSLNTIQNIRNVRQMVGDQRVALVTSGYHMPRAMELARRGGLSAAAFPTDWRVPAAAGSPWEHWVPSAAGLASSGIALREHLALLFDPRGR